jgi:DNA primase
MATDWVDFKTIRAQVGIVDILRHYGLFDDAHTGSEQFKIYCPFHDDSKPSCNIHTGMQAYRCFGCGVSGGIFDMVCLKEKINTGNDLEDDREAAHLISEWFGIAMSRNRPKRGQRKKAQEKTIETPAEESGISAETSVEGESASPDEPSEDEPINQPIGDESSWFPQRDPTHEYLTIERGFTPETIAHFGLGYHAGRGMMAGRIVIPSHNESGQLVAFAGRWPGIPPEGEPKYKLPPKFKASHVVYNLHRVPPDTHTLILVEGFFDVMALYQAASVPAIALMGTNLSEHQVEIITRTFTPDIRIVLAFDPDPAGDKCADTCLTHLGRSFWVKSVLYPGLIQEFKRRKHPPDTKA